MTLIASRNYPLIYFVIPKTGLTSTLNVLYYLDKGQFYDPPEKVHGNHGLPSNAACRHRLLTDTLFTFVRHPLRRAYSLFSEKAFYQHCSSFPALRRKLLRRGASLEPHDDLPTHRRDFLHFLRRVEMDVRQAKSEGRKMNPHWTPQHMLIARATRRHRKPDYIGRTERLAEDLTIILNRAGVVALPPQAHFNEGPRPLFRYEDVVDDEVKKFAARVFERDLELFGYKL